MIAAFAASKPLCVETGSPEWRAALFAQAIAYAAHLSGPICPHAIHRHLKSIVNPSDEQSRDELLNVVLMLIQTGLFTTSTMSEDGVILFEDDTMLTVTPMLTAYLYGGPDTAEDDED